VSDSKFSSWKISQFCACAVLWCGLSLFSEVDWCSTNINRQSKSIEKYRFL